MKARHVISIASGIGSAALQVVQAHGMPHTRLGWLALAADVVLGCIAPLSVRTKEAFP